MLLGDTEIGRRTAPRSLSTSPVPPVGVSPILATPGLEVEILRLLNSAGADLGEQVSATRTPAGELRVEGIVDTEQRKRELLNLLAPVGGNPAIKIQINTVAEALARERQTLKSGSTTIEPPEATTSTIPVDSDLRRYFMSKGFSAQVDDEVRQYATRIRSQSQDALMHAYALKGLVNRFSADDLTALDTEARAKWVALIRQHAQAIQRQTRAVREELEPVFFPKSADSSEEYFQIRTDADLVQAAERLFGLCSKNDKVIRSAFSISPDSSNASALRTKQFFSSLKSMERLAVTIQSAK